VVVQRVKTVIASKTRASRKPFVRMAAIPTETNATTPIVPRIVGRAFMERPFTWRPGQQG